jgi:isoleucyl-tRNA synthetase
MTEEKPQVNTGAPNFNDLEKGVLKFWDDNKIFEKSLEQTKGGESYIFYDGPPFATGLPHYGSILPSVIKDAIPRYQTMKGMYVRRRWGWDCHGLPIENIVEQHLKISGKKQIEEIGVDRFNQVCRDNVLTYAKEWGKTISRIGRWVEFDNAYMTMQTSYQESVWWALKKIWEKGLIYEDRKVLLYCSRCETPISNFEVAMDNSYKNVTENSVYSKFKLLKGQRIVNDLTNDKTYAIAWTTTPWTLPANTSLNVGPDIKYALVEQSGERYILAKERLSILEGQYEIISEFEARSLAGLQYEPPYPGVIPDNGKAHRIYVEDFVTVEDGTGLVHSAVMYGEEDFIAAKRTGLPQIPSLDHKGHYFNEDRIPEHLRGVFFKGAEKIILKELSEKGLVYKIEAYTHSYPHCYRCATPLFYNALPAWFIAIQKVKADLLKNNESVNWYPEHLKHGRFKLGLESAPDWNISRNRFWATALPFWKCENQECKALSCIGSVEELIKASTNFAEVYPNYNPENLEALDLHRPYIDNVKLKCEKCQGPMQRVPEVVDCWVESGSMPFAELHAPFENRDLFEERFPSDFVVEYIPQTRAWFYVMHVISTILFEHAPFKNVLTTGTILAEDGTKMSKSKKNYPDPNVIIEKYGADALRFYLLTSPVVNGEDINFSEKIVAETGRKINLLVYNVWSFYRMYEKAEIGDQKPASPSQGGSEINLNILDQWIIARLNQAHVLVTKYMDVFDTVRAGKEIVDFINDMSTWYLRRSRDRIKNGGQGAKDALSTLGYILVEVSKLLAPFTPFLADFIYKDLTGLESVHLASWSTLGSADEKVIAEMEVVREVVTVGLSVRKEKALAVRQPLAGLAFDFTDTKSILPEEYNQIILDEMNVKTVDVKLLDKDLRGEGVTAVAGAKMVKNFYLDLKMTLELKQEGVARELERQVQDLRKKSGLKVGELVDVYYNTADESLEDSLLNLLDRKKTFVSQISKSLEVEVDYEIQATVDGKAIWLGIVKI